MNRSRVEESMARIQQRSVQGIQDNLPRLVARSPQVRQEWLELCENLVEQIQ